MHEYLALFPVRCAPAAREGGSSAHLALCVECRKRKKQQPRAKQRVGISASRRVFHSTASALSGSRAAGAQRFIADAVTVTSGKRDPVLVAEAPERPGGDPGSCIRMQDDRRIWFPTFL
jgi:hypothetical protein